jgi:RNA polymerase sigma-70 factor, ECF subfamily
LDDAQQVAALYARFGPVVYRRCVRLLGNTEDARDATQLVFIRLLKNRRRFDSLDDALPWIHTVTTNFCFNWKRDARRRSGHLEALGTDEPLAPGLHEAAEDRQLAQHVLAKTDDETRDIAVGMLVEERQQQDVARALGVSEKTVQRKLRRFLDKAKRALTGGD